MIAVMSVQPEGLVKSLAFAIRVPVQAQLLSEY
jgi:hypothetical protein